MGSVTTSIHSSLDVLNRRYGTGSVRMSPEMRHQNATTVFGLAASLLTVMLITGSMLPAAGAANQAAGSAFAGQVVSASGAMFVGGAATNPGHPVAGATVHLVPITAIDITTPMTASAIYAATIPCRSLR